MTRKAPKFVAVRNLLSMANWAGIPAAERSLVTEHDQMEFGKQTMCTHGVPAASPTATS